MRFLLFTLLLVMFGLNSQKIKLRKCWTESDTFTNPKFYKDNQREFEFSLDSDLVSLQNNVGYSVAWFNTKDVFEIRYQTIPKIKTVTKYFKAQKKTGFSVGIFAEEGHMSEEAIKIKLLDLLKTLKQLCFEPIEMKIGVIQYQILFCCKFRMLDENVLAVSYTHLTLPTICSV